MSWLRRDAQIIVMQIVDPDVLKEFDCGDSQCNKRVLRDATDPTTVKYIFLSDDGKAVTTYASLSCSGVQKPVIPFVDLPIGEVPTPSIVSAVEIDYFVTDKRFQGKLINTSNSDFTTYSMDAFSAMVERVKEIAAAYAGVRAIVTYSVPKAEHFYEKCGMTRMPSDYIGRQDEFIKDCVPMILYL